MLRLAALASVLALAQLTGCASGRKPYPNDLPAKNLTIRTAVSGVRAALHVYGVDAQCRRQYLGTLDLNQPAVALGIAAARPAYLVVDFARSSLLGGRGSISRELAFKPLPNHRYEIDATYRDDIYNVVLRERRPNGSVRELPPTDPASCG